MLPAIAKHYGSTGAPWPPGSYWIVECECPGGARLFWMDDYDQMGRTGWAYLPVFGAGFATKADAEAAFAGRGKPVVEGGNIFAAEHQWVTT